MGIQKEARRKRLINEIYSFVSANPGVNSAAIVGYLTAEVKLRNSSLTPRKIGYFIPRHCKKKIRFEKGNVGRVYFPIKGLEDVVESDD